MNPINTYGPSGLGAYTPSPASTPDPNPAEETSRTQPSRTETSSPAPESAAPSASESASVQNASADALTAQEQQMIDKTFPEKPELSMRLYGRSRGTQTVNPDAVGSRLDVRG